MTKIAHCPFTRKSCIECALYRGRHHYLTCGNPHRKSADRPREVAGSRVHLQSASSRRFRDPLKGKTGAGAGFAGLEKEAKIRLKITDIESGETRTCGLSEAKAWNWTRPQMLRLIDGWQVNSLDHLMEIVYRKAEKGCQEVEVHEVPRFMLFSGG